MRKEKERLRFGKKTEGDAGRKEGKAGNTRSPTRKRRMRQKQIHTNDLVKSLTEATSGKAENKERTDGRIRESRKSNGENVHQTKNGRTGQFYCNSEKNNDPGHKSKKPANVKWIAEDAAGDVIQTSTALTRRAVYTDQGDSGADGTAKQVLQTSAVLAGGTSRRLREGLYGTRAGNNRRNNPEESARKYANDTVRFVDEETEGVGGAAEAKDQKNKAFQKRLIRHSYQKARYEKDAPRPFRNLFDRNAYEEVPAREAEKTAAKAGRKASRHPLLATLVFLLITVVTMSVLSAAAGVSLANSAVMPSTLGSSYTAEDADIKGTEQDYEAMEAGLAAKVDKLSEQYPGYSRYSLTSAQIGHNPFELAALLTVLHESYTREEVQDTLKEIFDLQYNLQTGKSSGKAKKKTVHLGESLGMVTASAYCSCPICCGKWSGGPTASGVMPTANHTIAVDAGNPFVPMGTKVVMNGVEYTVEDTGAFSRYGRQFDIYFDNHQEAVNFGIRTFEAYLSDENGTKTVEVLSGSGKSTMDATLANRGIRYAAEQLLDEDQLARYELLVETKGNREDLFSSYVRSGTSGTVQNYRIPGEALSDEKFANMAQEAQKYLGMPYVWGGSSPSTSFDCSGFVCWVINNCGNGWNVGRTTAEGLRLLTAEVPPSEAKPGDIIFFQGTYDTPGASHVGIYLGNNMMIHCGDPIQYANISGSYWQQHFMCFGRLS